MTPGGLEPITTASRLPAGSGTHGWLLRIARALFWSDPAAAGQGPVVPLTVAGNAGPVVKHTSPLIVVPGPVLVKVLETRPKLPSEPRFGAVCARADAPTKNSAAKPNPVVAAERAVIFMVPPFVCACLNAAS